MKTVCLKTDDDELHTLYVNVRFQCFSQKNVASNSNTCFICPLLFISLDFMALWGCANIFRAVSVTVGL